MTKWCPFARVGFWMPGAQDAEGPAAVNRATPHTDARYDEYRANVHHSTRCLGSVCMAWRWARLHPVALVSKPMAPEEIEALRAAGNTSFLEIRDEDQKPIIVPNMGFCGMAGPSDRVP